MIKVIPAEWVAIAARMERERKFRVELQDLGFVIAKHEFLIDPQGRPKEYMWNMQYPLAPAFDLSITVDKANETVISMHKGFDIAEFKTPVSWNNFIELQKKKFRAFFTEALASLDKSTYTPQSILDNV